MWRGVGPAERREQRHRSRCRAKRFQRAAIQVAFLNMEVSPAVHQVAFNESTAQIYAVVKLDGDFLKRLIADHFHAVISPVRVVGGGAQGDRTPRFQVPGPDRAPSRAPSAPTRGDDDSVASSGRFPKAPDHRPLRRRHSASPPFVGDHEWQRKSARDVRDSPYHCIRSRRMRHCEISSPSNQSRDAKRKSRDIHRNSPLYPQRHLNARTPGPECLSALEARAWVGPDQTNFVFARLSDLGVYSGSLKYTLANVRAESRAPTARVQWPGAERGGRTHFSRRRSHGGR